MSAQLSRLAEKFEKLAASAKRPALIKASALIARAQEGPQKRFVESDADLTFYGGSAGGGKSYGLLLGAARDADTFGADAIILRREAVMLGGPGGLLARSQEIYGGTGADVVASHPIKWTFPSGAMIELRHLQLEKHKFGHQGKEYACIAFDELTHFTETQFWYMFSRVRTMSGKRGRVLGTFNPDPDSWVFPMISWFIDQETGYPIPERSGVIRYFWRDDNDKIEWADSREELIERCPNADPEAIRSFTFIAATLADNAALMKADPGYRGRLMSLPRVERMRLLFGNWLERDRTGKLFAQLATYEPDALPRCGLRFGIGFDLAYSRKTSSDYSVWVVLAKEYLIERAFDVDLNEWVEHDVSRYYVIDVRRVRVKLPEFAAMTKTLDEEHPTALRRTYVGGTEKGGIDTIAATMGVHLGEVPATSDKYVRIQPAAKVANAGRLFIPTKAPWVAAFKNEIESFTGDDKVDAFDDQIDALAGAFDVLQGDGVLVATAPSEATTRVAEKAFAGRVSGGASKLFGR